MKDIFTKEETEEIYKEIRLHPTYAKHAKLYKQYMANGQYAQATIEAKIMKEMEIASFAEIAKEKNLIWKAVQDKIAQMSDEDKHYLNVFSNAMMMLADVVENFIMDTNTIMKKYGLNNVKEYDKLKVALKESKACVRRFDTLTNDEKVSSMFGDCSDNLYKLIFNKASSFVNKVKKHEESVNKKAARHTKVA